MKLTPDGGFEEITENEKRNKVGHSLRDAAGASRSNKSTAKKTKKSVKNAVKKETVRPLQPKPEDDDNETDDNFCPSKQSCVVGTVSNENRSGVRLESPLPTISAAATAASRLEYYVQKLVAQAQYCYTYVGRNRSFPTCKAFLLWSRLQNWLKKRRWKQRRRRSPLLR